MKIQLVPGSYIVAVSGGVDSVVMLDLASNSQKIEPNIKLVVAHFDHGIRPDSHEDRLFVKDLSKKYGLKYVSASTNLGENTSEEVARNRRYEFLRKVKQQENAKAILLAHHQDDQIETAAINILRGTNRRGLTSLKSHDDLIRPLLDFTKQQILDYAKANKLSWNEDSTNKDTKYTRNYIRHEILSKLSSDQKIELISVLEKQTKLNQEINQIIRLLLQSELVDSKLPRLWFNQLDNSLSREILVEWLRQSGVYSYDKKTIDRLVNNLKVAKPMTKINVLKGQIIVVDKQYLALKPLER